MIFYELKGKNIKRDFITFQDFKNAIVHYKIQLMRGLSSTDPDFHDYCKELFMIICQNTADINSYWSNLSAPAKKFNHLFDSNVEKDN